MADPKIACPLSEERVKRLAKELFGSDGTRERGAIRSIANEIAQAGQPWCPDDPIDWRGHDQGHPCPRWWLLGWEPQAKPPKRQGKDHEVKIYLQKLNGPSPLPNGEYTADELPIVGKAFYVANDKGHFDHTSVVNRIFNHEDSFIIETKSGSFYFIKPLAEPDLNIRVELIGGERQHTGTLVGWMRSDMATGWVAVVKFVGDPPYQLVRIAPQRLRKAHDHTELTPPSVPA